MKRANIIFNPQMGSASIYMPSLRQRPYPSTLRMLRHLFIATRKSKADVTELDANRGNGLVAPADALRSCTAAHSSLPQLVTMCQEFIVQHIREGGWSAFLRT